MVSGEGDDLINFVLVKTPSCPKCEVLLQKADQVFGTLAKTVAYFVYEVKDRPAAEKLNELAVMAVPVILYRFKDEELWNVGKITPDVEDNFIELTNIFDAIRDNDHSFFGYNEFDEEIETDYDYDMNRLLRSIYGEVDPEVTKERQTLKQECEHCRVLTKKE
jgi:hypothetical protein